MHKKINYYLQILLLFFDLLSLNFIFIITLFVFDRSTSFQFFYPYLSYWFYQNIFWIILVGLLRLYSEHTIIKFETFIKRTAQVILIWIILNLCFLVFSRHIDFSRLFIFLSMCNFALVLVLNRFLYFGFKNYITLQSKLVNKVIILGYNETAKKLARYFEEDELHTQLLGFVEDENNMNEVTHYPVLAGINNLIDVAESLKVQEIYSTLTPEQNKYIYTLMNDAENKCMRFKVVPNLSLFLSILMLMYWSPLGILFFHSPEYPNLLFFNNRDASKKGNSTIKESDFFLILFTIIWSLEFLMIHVIFPDETVSIMLKTML